MELYIPRPPLNRYVEGLWHVDMQIDYRNEKILPSPRLELIVNFGAPFRLESPQMGANALICTDGWLVGLQTAPLVNEPLAETHMIGVRFRPGGQQALFALPASDFTDQVVPLDALWGYRADSIRAQLAERKTPAERFALLERLLLERLLMPRVRPAVDAALDAIRRTHGVLSLGALARDLGISAKHLAHQFRAAVGVTPKALARTYRLEHALRSIDPSRPVNWAQIAHEANYYDQAHFNHEFTVFTGLSPTEYVRLRREIYGAALQPGDEVHFVPLG